MMKSCKKGYYYCNTDKQCKPIPDGHTVRDDGFLVKEEGLRAWFGKSSGTTKSGRKVKGWVQVGGKYDGKPCARQPGQKTTPKCTSSSKRASMSDKERDSAARRKRAADPNQPQKSGAAAPTMVSTDPKRKMKEEFSTLPLKLEIPKSALDFKQGLMFRESLDVDSGMLFVFDNIAKQSFHMTETKIPLDIAFIREDGVIESIKELEPNNPLPVYSEGDIELAIEVNRGWFAENNVEVGDQLDVEYIIPNQREKYRSETNTIYNIISEVKDKKGKGSGSKDACYHKVKSRYSVWPSAYASGALVKCRKKGAANWGNKSEAYEINVADAKGNTPAYQGYMSGKKNKITGKPLYKASKDYLNRAKGVKENVTIENSDGQVIASVENIIGPENMKPITTDDGVWKGTEQVSEMKRDEYGDPVGGPKISKKQKAKNLASNTPDEQHTTTTSEGSAYGMFKGSGKPSGQMAAFGKQEKKPNPYGKRAKLKMLIKGFAEKERMKAGVTKEEVIVERQKDSDNQRLSLERGRSNYGKASIRNMRASGKGGNAADPAERLVAMDARHKAHKEKRGVKTKGMSEAKMEGGYISNAAKAEVRNQRRFGKKGSATPQGYFGQKPSEKAELAVKRGEEHKARRGVKTKSNWREDLNIEEGAAWTKKSGKSASGGLNEKGRKSYERENPGSDLKAPSKKVGNPRRKSFCARMKGMKKKLTSAKTARDPDSRINKSLRAWNC